MRQLIKKMITYVFYFNCLLLSSCGWYKFVEEIPSNVELESSGGGSNSGGGNGNLNAKLTMSNAPFGGYFLSGFSIDQNGNFVGSNLIGQIAKYNSSGDIVWEFSQNSTSVNSNSSPAALYLVYDIVTDANGNIYVSTSGTSTIIKSYDSNGKFRWKSAAQAGGNQFYSLAVHPSGYLFAAHNASSSAYIRRFDLSTGVEVGNAYNVSNTNFGYIHWSIQNQLLVPAINSSGGQRVLRLELTDAQDATSDLTLSSQIGTTGTSGIGNTEFNQPYCATSDSSGNIYVCDSLNKRILKFDSYGNYLSTISVYNAGTREQASSVQRARIFSDQLYVNLGNILVLNLSGQFQSDLMIPSLKFHGIAKRDQSGNEYYAETTSSNGWRNLTMTINKYDQNQNILLSFGAYGTGVGQFQSVEKMHVTANGKVIVYDSYLTKIIVFNANGTVDHEVPFNITSVTFEAIEETNDYIIARFSNTKIQRYRLSDGQFVDEYAPGGGFNVYKIAVDQSNGTLFFQNISSSRSYLNTLTTTVNSFGTHTQIYDTTMTNITITDLVIDQQNLLMSISSPLTAYQQITIIDLNTNTLTKKIGYMGSYANETKGCTTIFIRNNSDIVCADSLNNRIGIYSQTDLTSLNFSYAIPTVLSNGQILMTDLVTGASSFFDHNLSITSSFGSAGNGNGQFSYANKIEVDSNGQFYVLDVGNSRIQKFDSSGNYLSQWAVDAGTYSMSLSGNQICSSEINTMTLKCTDLNGGNQVSLVSQGIVKLKHLQNGEFVGSRMDSQTGLVGLVILNSDGSLKKNLTKNNQNIETVFGEYGLVFNDIVIHPTNGNIYISDYESNVIYKFDSYGDYISEQSFPGPSRMAIYNNTLLVVPAGHRIVQIQLF